MLSDKAVRGFRETFKKDHGKEYADTETGKATERLVGFYQLLIKVYQRNERNKDEKKQKN